ncbi:MAG: nucleoside triphosphate pyrophosphatase [Sphingomonadales bacterium]|nr:nucleoside triphosphate pyrophosphatase [Sphingomonadales bacterium]
MKLLLASKSEARRHMLAAAGVPFETVEAELDEAAAKAGLEAAGFDARGVAEELAQLKALSVEAAGGTLVLGADQTLELEDGAILSKPNSRGDAFDQLRLLSGRSHALHSAAVVVEDGETVFWQSETVELTMRALTDRFIEDYLDREYEAIRWSVGGYRIEGPGVQLFERIEGSHFAVLGLPLLQLLAFFRERGLLAS